MEDELCSRGSVGAYFFASSSTLKAVSPLFHHSNVFFAIILLIHSIDILTLWSQSPRHLASLAWPDFFPVGQSAGQLVSWSLCQSVSKSVSLSFSQAGSLSISQSIS